MQAAGTKNSQAKLSSQAHEILWRHAQRLLQAEPEMVALILESLLEDALPLLGAHSITLLLAPAQRDCFACESISCSLAGMPSGDATHCFDQRDYLLENSRAQLQIRYRSVERPEQPLFNNNLAELIDTALSSAVRTAAARQQQRHDKTLVRELHHRTKNNLQVVFSLLDLQSMRSDSTPVSSALGAAATRVSTIAIVHDTMCQADGGEHMNLRAFVIGLIVDLRSLFCIDGSEPAIEVDVEELALKLEHATPCALMLNELLCNSFKYAFQDRQNGRILVEAKRNHEQISIRVADNGKGIPAENQNAIENGFGFTIIRELADQLSANLTFDGSNGFECLFSFRETTDTEKFVL
jgi:two-component sensor histidine kinase